jgi:hypothetical protein
MKRFALIAILLAALPSLHAATASTPPAPKWKALGTGGSTAAEMLSLGRRTLLVWNRPNPTGGSDLAATVFGANGSVTTKNIVEGWYEVSVASVVKTKAGGARVIFGGTEAYAGNVYPLNTATAPASLAKWTLSKDPLAPAGKYPELAATLTKDSTLLTAWTDTTHTGVGLRRGLDPDSPVRRYGPNASVNQVLLATDAATGAVHMLMCPTGQDGKPALLVQGVNPASGQPKGKATSLSGSSSPGKTRGCGAGMAARKGGGVFVAAAGPIDPSNDPFVPGSAKKVLLWKLGKKNPTILASNDMHHTTARVSADATGRVWAAWIETDTVNHEIILRKSNPKVDTWAKPIKLAPPQTQSLGDVNVSAVAGGAWVVMVGRAADLNTTVYYTKVIG